MRGEQFQEDSERSDALCEAVAGASLPQPAPGEQRRAAARGAPGDAQPRRRTPSARLRERSSPIDNLYFAHFHSLKQFVVKRVGNHEDAADIVQDVFLRVALRYCSKPGGELKAILYKAAHNASIDFLMLEETRRRRAAVDIHDLSGAIACDRQASPERQLSDRELLAIARKALSGMKPSRRAILLMHRVDGLEYAEIADRMGVSISTVTREIAKAVAAIKEKMPR